MRYPHAKFLHFYDLGKKTAIFNPFNLKIAYARSSNEDKKKYSIISSYEEYRLLEKFSFIDSTFNSLDSNIKKLMDLAITETQNIFIWKQTVLY
jgi:hypothetical protein